jgi:hypothetical protein
MQLEVEGKENEIKAAPRLLKYLDLRGKVMSADALLAQRELLVQVVESGGEYVWVVKDNQPQLCDDIATLFEPESCFSGFSSVPKGLRTATTLDKGQKGEQDYQGTGHRRQIIL